MNQFIQACPSLVLAKRLEALGHPLAIGMIAAEAPHHEIATRWNVSLQDDRTQAFVEVLRLEAPGSEPEV